MNGIIEQNALDNLHDYLITNTEDLRLTHPTHSTREESDAHFERIVGTARALAVYYKVEGEGLLLQEFDEANTDEIRIRDFIWSHSEKFMGLIKKYEASNQNI